MRMQRRCCGRGTGGGGGCRRGTAHAAAAACARRPSAAAARLGQRHAWRLPPCAADRASSEPGAAPAATEPASPRAPQRGAVTNSLATPSGQAALGAFLSTTPSAVDAVAEAVAAIREGVGGDAFAPELALVFATAAHGDALQDVVPTLRRLVPSLRHVFGCTVRAMPLGLGWGGVLPFGCYSRRAVRSARARRRRRSRAAQHQRRRLVVVAHLIQPRSTPPPFTSAQIH